MASESSDVQRGSYRPANVDPVRRRATRILKASVSTYITFDERYIPDHNELIEVLTDLRARGCIIIFTTGVWDMFHIGHGDYMQKGRDEAVKLYPDAEHFIMVVGLDTDALTKERKGPQRPIVPENERAKILGHLRPVDIITPQYKLNQLFGMVSPHVLIVSTSTKDLPPDLMEAKKHCENVVCLPPQAETTTSARVRRLTMDGGFEMFERIRNRMTAFFEEIQNELKS